MVDLSHLLTHSDPVTWLFCGDSITQGAVHTRGWRDYTQLFKERLGELARNEDLVLNSAVGGWSVSALLPRLEERVLRLQPDVLFLMFGTNDAAAGPDQLSTFSERYVQVVERVQSAGIGSVMMQTTVPMMPVDPEGVIATAAWPDPAVREAKLRGLRLRLACLEQYTEATRDVAHRCGVALVDHWTAWLAVGGRRGQLLDGGFHPNEYGHRLLAHTLFRECGMWEERSWTCRLFVPVDSL